MKSEEPIQLTNFTTLTDGQIQISSYEDEEDHPSKLATILSEIRQMKVELLMFVYTLSYALRSVSQTTIIIDKVCLVHFNYSSRICFNISYYPDVKNEVVKLANNYLLGYNFLAFLTSSILVIFIGSWSDKYSRRVPVIVALIGMLIDDVGTTLCSLFMDTRVEFLFIPAFINGLSGGFIAIMAVLYSYISDITTVSNRTMKYTLFQASVGLSMPIGIAASGYIFKYFGYNAIFLIATAGHVLALLWVVFFVKETRGLENTESWKLKLRNLFSTENVIASFHATVKKRPNQGKKQILFLMFCMSIALLHQASVGTIGFSYVHHRFDWDNTKFSTVFGIFTMVGTFATLFIVPMFKKMKLGDSTLGFVGSISAISKSLLMGLATNEYLYYIANMIGVLDMLVPLAGRSRISKIVSKDDIGKIFSFLSMVESVLPSLATAAVSQIFNASLDFFPGLVYVILGAISLISVGVFLWITRLPKADYDEKEDVFDAVEDVPDKNGSIKITDDDSSTNNIEDTEPKHL
ncbi:proton-coupled folate transporter-like [Uloborus diversus]|uniref:proton-coupled folate transporter-like n=1 Tax=Uloborus diversus TaxID=327109 RepID=UPI002409DD1D|nr:proton-coupled folate transporter-like [Uloborus diversus]